MTEAERGDSYNLWGILFICGVFIVVPWALRGFSLPGFLFGVQIGGSLMLGALAVWPLVKLLEGRVSRSFLNLISVVAVMALARIMFLHVVGPLVALAAEG